VAANPRTIFDAVLDALIEPVIVTDAEGVLTFANAPAAQSFGADRDVGRPAAEHLARFHMRTADGHPLPPSLHPMARARAMRQAVIGAELTIGGEQGETTYIVNSVPLWAGETMMGTVSVFHDITTAARLEREVAEHAARLETVVNLVNDGVFIIGLDSRIMFANSVGSRFLELPHELDINERARRLRVTDVDGRMMSPSEAPSSRVFRGETVSDMEFVIEPPSGARRHIRANAHPLRRADGTVYAALVTWHDVTDELAARAEIERARQSAEEANRLKDQFIAALSHELRTPLQPILGWTEVLRRHGRLDDVTTRALEAIHRNIRQQVRLVDDLLDLSRIVHGKFALRFESFDMRDQVRSAVEAFEEGAAHKRVRLTMSVPTEPVPMWGDGARLNQVVTNLLSNALKFTPSGGRVSVRLTAEEGRAVLEVEDSGEGIAPEDQPIIFEAFRQGTQSRRRGGLGIGLDLVRRLTQLHGGSVRVFSEGAGRGARFRAELPLAPRRREEPGPHAAVPGRLRGRTVLVVEDNPDTRDVLKFMLEVEGARVVSSSSGEDGVRSAVAFAPHVVICDIGLPDIDGMEVARRLRALDELRGARLIALTGYGQAEDVRQAIDAGFDAHLTKPINLDQLIALLALETDAPRA
jgi:signal transduction histidine kinase/ActR/RegA family two-component response regulator